MNWPIFDPKLGSFILLQLAAVFMLTWITINEASTAFRFEIAPGWYRFGCALASFNVDSLQLEVHSWSGSANKSKIALPVLFAWWAPGTSRSSSPFASGAQVCWGHGRGSDAVKRGAIAWE